MSRQYETGNRWEQLTANLFRANGYEVWQSRGSKSAADLIAIKRGDIVLVQVKRCSRPNPETSQIIGGDEWNTLYDLAAHLDAQPVLADWGGIRGTRAVLRLRRLIGRHTPGTRFWPMIPFRLDFAEEEAGA